MTLEELIAQMSFVTDDIEDNFDRGLALSFLYELKEWRKNPFLMIKKHCEEIPHCNECDYDDFCCGHSNAVVPEEWKF